MTEAADIPVPDAAGVSSTLSLRLYPSARLTLVLTAVHVGALVCLLQVELAPMLDGVLATLVCASAYRTLRRDARLSSPDAVLSLTWLQRGGWHLTTRSGNVLYATLGPDSHAHPLLVILRFRVGRGGRRTVILLPDMVLSARTLRQLRRRLSCG